MAVLPPPPAPFLGIVGDYLNQVATGGDDTGGTLKLYKSGDGVSNWELVDTAAWSASHNWLELAELEEGFYKGTEIGNGVSYSSAETASNLYEVIV